MTEFAVQIFLNLMILCVFDINGIHDAAFIAIHHINVKEIHSPIKVGHTNVTENRGVSRGDLRFLVPLSNAYQTKAAPFIAFI